MPTCITTWNANSIRLRESALRRIVAELRPDVLCLQEIKVEDGRFPAELCRELGFAHLHVHGQKAYHGVAVLSKLPLDGAKPGAGAGSRTAGTRSARSRAGPSCTISISLRAAMCRHPS